MCEEKMRRLTRDLIGSDLGGVFPTVGDVKVIEPADAALGGAEAVGMGARKIELWRLHPAVVGGQADGETGGRIGPE